MAGIVLTVVVDPRPSLHTIEMGSQLGLGQSIRFVVGQAHERPYHNNVVWIASFGLNEDVLSDPLLDDLRLLEIGLEFLTRL